MSRVALIPWGNVIEDYLDTIGVSLDAFCDDMDGGWLFGYFAALRAAGVDGVLLLVSSGVSAPERRVHRASGLPIRILPAARAYRLVRRRVAEPYGWNVGRMFGIAEPGRLRRAALAPARALFPYFATPPVALAAALREEQVGALLCQEYEYARFDSCVAVGRATGVPVFGVFQGGDAPFSAFERRVRGPAVRAAAGLIIPTRRELERVHETYGVPRAALAQIFNPLDLSEWSPLPRDEARRALDIPETARVAVSHGRIEIHRKGLDIMLAAWAEVVRARPGRDYRLVIVGSGGDAAEFGRRLDAAALPGLTWANEFVLDRTSVRRTLSAGDVYVMTSRKEGFPVAPVEAMACGLPIVASDAHGVADILELGEASGGILVPREGVAATAAALLRLLDDPELGRSLGASARRRVEARFGLEAVGAELRDFLVARGARDIQTPNGVAANAATPS
jgi:starch synthase